MAPQAMTSLAHKPAPGASRLVGPAIVALVAFLAFIPALNAGYSQFDDYSTLIDNQEYRGLGLDNIRWMFTTTHMGHYQPLAWLSFALEWTVVGAMNPVVSHTVNLVIHAINAALVCFLARRLITIACPSLPLRNAEAGGVIAALLFAVHPLRAESVAWVTERRDVLSLMFYLLALLAYIRAYPPESTRPQTTGQAMIVLLFFILSLLSKAWGMTIFLVLLTLDWYPLRRLPLPGAAWVQAGPRTVLIQKLPFAVVGLCWAYVAGMAQSSAPGATHSLAEWGVIDRLCQAAYGTMFYVWKTIVPTGLAALYELPASMRPNEPRVIAGFAVCALLGIAAILLRRRGPAVTVAVLTYVFIVSPVLGLFQSGIQLVADRYSYISTLGFAIVAGGAAAVVIDRLKPRTRAIAAAAIILLIGTLTVRSWMQSRLWRSTETLMANAVAVGQDGPILRAYYGKEIDRRSAHEQAIEQFQKSIALKPDYGEAWISLGNTLKSMDRIAEAEAAYAKAQALMPDSWRADVELGLMLAEKKDDLESGLRLFRIAVEKIEGPQNWAFQPGPYMLLAQALYDSGDVEGARRQLLKAKQHRGTHDKAVAALRIIAGDKGGR